MNDSNTVYKLIGPILMKVDIEEARHNVSKRMEFIENDMKRLDDLIASRQGEQTSLGEQIRELQLKMQADAANAAREVAMEALKNSDA